MEEKLSKDEMLFANLVLMFETAAMQHLGKLKNPVTDKIERDIEQAKLSIDILEMLQRKTEGNLGDYEKKMLKSVLHELRMNYVYELDKQHAEGTAGKRGTGDPDTSSNETTGEKVSE